MTESANGQHLLVRNQGFLSVCREACQNVSSSAATRPGVTLIFI